LTNRILLGSFAMQAATSTHYVGKDKVLALLGALAEGTAAEADVTATLRDQGIESVPALLAAFTEAARKRQSESQARWINLKQLLARPADVTIAPTRTVHRVPKLPFLLNGTLYDPQDVQRFNGMDLHFCVSHRRNHIVAIDDRELMIQWWQLKYLDELTNPKLEEYRYGGHQSGPGPDPQAGPPDMVVGKPSPQPQNFWLLHEDAHFSNDFLSLETGHYYGNLTSVGKGFFGVFGLDDWNDVISSMKQLSTANSCIVFEHKQFGVEDGGDSLTVVVNEPNLEDLGWNDRITSVIAL
jgi:hypothetical protein